MKEEDQAIVIVSRPYNGCDPGINLNLPKKLRDLGALPIPMDYLDLDSVFKERMGQALEEIRSGAFAKEWSSDRRGKLDLIKQIREVQAGLPITGWDEATRRAFRIGEAGKCDPVSDES